MTNRKRRLICEILLGKKTVEQMFAIGPVRQNQRTRQSHRRQKMERRKRQRFHNQMGILERQIHDMDL